MLKLNEGIVVKGLGKSEAGFDGRRPALLPILAMASGKSFWRAHFRTWSDPPSNPSPSLLVSYLRYKCVLGNSIQTYLVWGSALRTEAEASHFHRHQAKRCEQVSVALSTLEWPAKPCRCVARMLRSNSANNTPRRHVHRHAD